MNDWLEILFNGFWVGGLATLLAAWSWASWLTGKTHSTWRDTFRRPAIRMAAQAGWVFFCLGLALTAHRRWEQILWGLLITIFLVQVIWMSRKSNR